MSASSEDQALGGGNKGDISANIAADNSITTENNFPRTDEGNLVSDESKNNGIGNYFIFFRH